MTWNPLKKVTLQKPTSSEPFGLNDGGLEKEVEALQIVEESSRALCKEAKRYKELIAEVSQSELKTSSDLSGCSVIQTNDSLRQMVEEYHTITRESHNHVRSLEEVCQTAVVDPLKKYTTSFTNVQETLKKREQAVQECNKQQQKMIKYSTKEKTGPNVSKHAFAKAALQAAKEEVSAHNSQLLKEIPHILDARIDYFQPSLEALIKAEVDYYGESTKLISAIQESAKQSKHLPEDLYQQQIQSKLAEIRALSIVASD